MKNQPSTIATPPTPVWPRPNRSRFPNLIPTLLFGAVMGLALVLAAPARAANIAPQGTAILGVNDAIDSDAGTLHVNSGVAANINDEDSTTRVDTWFGNAPTDMGQKYSFVGILWPSKRYDPISGLNLTLATFTDGGWFGVSGAGPGSGGTLTAGMLLDPVVQVTSDGGVTWTDVDFDSDYFTALEGHVIGDGAGVNPTSVSIPFFLFTPLTRINGVRIIGENGGNAGPDTNGFLGVFELNVGSGAFTDTDGDGLPDEWEEDNGLVVGVNDAGLDPDGDGLNNLGEYNAGSDPNQADTDGDGLNDGSEVLTYQTDPLKADTDEDGLSDGDEVNTHMTDPLAADTDQDGLTDGDEVNIYFSNPLLTDTDGDGFPDGFEVSQGSDPSDPTSFPNNFALLGNGIMGTKASLDSGPETEVFYYHAGASTSINDGDLTTRVDTWNSTTPDTVSFVGILWDETVTDPILRLELTMATFLDGGWFGANNAGPGAGGALTASQLIEPQVEITTDGGTTWTVVPHTSDYLSALLGHRIGGGTQPNPSSVSATFTLDQPAIGINGIRIIGTEGGTASGGFIGVFELAVRGEVSDADQDGMEDDWERMHGLIVGTNDAALDPDGDGLTNLEEFEADTDPHLADTDGDGLDDGPEVKTHMTDPLKTDTDADNLSDGAEVVTYHTNPLLADSDGDGFLDGLEVAEGSDPTNPSSVPNNFALTGTGILGTKEALDSGLETAVFNSGSAASINDGDPTTRVDTYNGGSLDTVSFVGILWTQPITEPIVTLDLTLSTFFDGGWFGPNNVGPGAGGTLSAATDLIEPRVEVTVDGGATWTPVASTSDYLTAVDGHALPAIAFGAPTAVTAEFQLTDPQTGINGIRIIGTEGGTASGGFLGVFELAVRGVVSDSDHDGMEDAWERLNGLTVGVDDSAEDPDGDGLTNLEEFDADTNPQLADTDGDGLDDGAELNTYNTNPLVADSDGDGLSDGDEVNNSGTDPLLADSDSDGVSDGREVAVGSDPLDAFSHPINIASSGTGLLGTKAALDSGAETALFHSGSATSITDGSLSTRVDTYNGGTATAADTVSFVGISWAAPLPQPVVALNLTLATFGDGGWFGANNLAPGAGQPLTEDHLVEPRVEISTDGGATWVAASHTSDYLTAGLGHRIGGGGQPNPSTLSATFRLDAPATAINGIRIIGTEGGTASGGFLGVFDLAAYVLAADTDHDQMDDFWESTHGLIVGVNDAAEDPDGDGLTNQEEFQNNTDPQAADTDGDGLADGAELNQYQTDPLVADTDGDRLNDGDEVNAYGSNPLVKDTDGDGFIDGFEAAEGSDPADPSSIPSNIAPSGTGILGTKVALDTGAETPVFNSGTAANINDGLLTTRVDNYNGASLDTVSFVGILWANPVPDPIVSLKLTLATFGDGGWFGVNNLGPGAGGALTDTYLAEPRVEVTSDGGATWVTAASTSDYLTALEGHLVGGGGQPNPTSATATFTLGTPADGINGIRIIGTEGGTASGGFLGVFELAANTGTSAPPVAADDSASTPEDTVVTIDILANDTDPNGSALTVSNLSDPDHGSIVDNGDGTVTYAPDGNFNGTDGFAYTIRNAQGLSAMATVTVTVLPVNDAPVANDDAAVTPEDTPVTVNVLANDVDPDGDVLSVAAGPAGSGQVQVNDDGTVTYIPNPNSNGSDQFSYTVTDAQGEVDSAQVTVTVTAVNDPPAPAIKISPLTDLGPTMPGLIVISPNNQTACVTLDGRNSSDVDNDSSQLSFIWMVDDTPIGVGPTLDTCLLVGTRSVTLLVDDGQPENHLGMATVAVEVLSASEALEDLILIVNDSVLDRPTKRPFIATLKAAVAALDRGSVGAGLNQLKAFQNKVRAQIGKDNPDVAEEWVRITQEIMDGASHPQDCNCDE
jgi:Bacterial Ig domain/Bacterial TSP3 repeat